MKARLFILRSAAFVLMLAFSQKTGAGLLLHNWLHTSQSADESDSGQAGSEVSYACNCIDDFLVPFIGEEETIVLSPAPVLCPVPGFLAAAVPVRNTSFAALRGPPSSIL